MDASMYFPSAKTQSNPSKPTICLRIFLLNPFSLELGVLRDRAQLKGRKDLTKITESGLRSSNQSQPPRGAFSPLSLRSQGDPTTISHTSAGHQTRPPTTISHPSVGHQTPQPITGQQYRLLAVMQSQGKFNTALTPQSQCTQTQCFSSPFPL